MRYISTRGDTTERRFCDILLEGLAPDGGLYMPVRYPVIDAAALASLRTTWSESGYAELAYALLSLYIDDIPAADLKALCHKTYTQEAFGTAAIVPVRRTRDGFYIEALSNGPTLAFKDMAMQLLGNLFEYELARRHQTLNILGATSGDTGSAAEYAMRGKQGIRVFMTSPADRMSPFQQAQMFGLPDANIINIAVEGVFDDCQDMVKSVSNDLAFKRAYKIGTVNSINWARLLAQVVYYFAGYFQATADNSEKVNFVVPSGNFGNVCAGHVARMMGLPIAQLVVATNENNVLDEFFKTGVYRVRSSADTVETSSPSMDISKASNFERFVFDVLQRDGARVKDLFDRQLTSTGQFDVSQTPAFINAAANFGLISGSSTHANRLSTIAHTHAMGDGVIDPHTADALYVAMQLKANGQLQVCPTVILETALPIKFAHTIVQAVGIEPTRPAHLEGIEALPKRVIRMKPDVILLKELIARTCESEDSFNQSSS